MNHIPEVSIITVCRNAESCLGSTMDSILSQTFQPIEYIRTLALIKEREAAFRSRGIAFRWLSEPDGGIYDAMNKGIRLASGRWLNFMNAGDGFHDAEVLADIFSREEYPSEVGVIYGDTELRLSFGFVEMRPKPLEYMKKKEEDALLPSVHFCKGGGNEGASLRPHLPVCRRLRFLLSILPARRRFPLREPPRCLL